MRTVFVEEVVQEPRALRQGQELGAEPEQPARGNRELHSRAVAVAAEVLQLAPALAERGDHGPVNSSAQSMISSS